MDCVVRHSGHSFVDRSRRTVCGPKRTDRSNLGIKVNRSAMWISVVLRSRGFKDIRRPLCSIQFR